MKRTTNFSRKKVIKPALVRVSLTNNNGSYYLKTDINELPSVSSEYDVAIFLRVRADTKVWRKYYLGTIDQVENLENEIFPDIEEGRTKVVQVILNLVEQSGSRVNKAVSKILTIQKFRFEEDDDIAGESESDYSLVTVDYDREGRLGEVPWQIYFSDEPEIRPNLVLHQSFKDVELKQEIFTGNGTAQTLILVQIIREVLKYLIVENDCNPNDVDSEEGWQKIWLMWAANMGSIEFPNSDHPEEKKQWIEEVVDEFCRKKRLVQFMKSNLAGS